MNQNLSKIEYCICIDLDDTLYNEIDYIISGYREISKYIEKNQKIKIRNFPKKEDVLNYKKTHLQRFLKKNQVRDISIKFLINILRNHKPKLSLSKKNLKKLILIRKYFKNLILITNGRKITQRNKIKSLNINKFFKKIFISGEIGVKKPNKLIYKKIFNEFPNANKVFIGDNLYIDLMTPIRLKEKTIIIKNKNNRIHKLNENDKSFKKINLIYEQFHEIKINDIKNLFC